MSRRKKVARLTNKTGSPWAGTVSTTGNIKWDTTTMGGGTYGGSGPLITWDDPSSGGTLTAKELKEWMDKIRGYEEPGLDLKNEVLAKGKRYLVSTTRLIASGGLFGEPYETMIFEWPPGGDIDFSGVFQRRHAAEHIARAVHKEVVDSLMVGCDPDDIDERLA